MKQTNKSKPRRISNRRTPTTIYNDVVCSFIFLFFEKKRNISFNEPNVIDKR